MSAKDLRTSDSVLSDLERLRKAVQKLKELYSELGFLVTFPDVPEVTGDDPPEISVRFRKQIFDAVVRLRELNLQRISSATDVVQDVVELAPTLSPKSQREVSRLLQGRSLHASTEIVVENLLDIHSSHARQVVANAERIKTQRLAIDEEFGLLTSEEVAEILGVSMSQVTRLATRKKLLRAKAYGQYRYPGFQFDGDEIHALIPVTLKAFGDEKSWPIIHWLTSVNGYLTADPESPVRPVDVMDDDPAAFRRVLELETHG